MAAARATSQPGSAGHSGLALLRNSVALYADRWHAQCLRNRAEAAEHSRGVLQGWQRPLHYRTHVLLCTLLLAG